LVGAQAKPAGAGGSDAAAAAAAELASDGEKAWGTYVGGPGVGETAEEAGNAVDALEDRHWGAVGAGGALDGASWGLVWVDHSDAGPTPEEGAVVGSPWVVSVLGSLEHDHLGSLASCLLVAYQAVAA